MGVFAAVEAFVRRHRPCGSMTVEAAAPGPSGYRLILSCGCGAAFERWVTPEAADRDLLRSRLAALPN